MLVQVLSGRLVWHVACYLPCDLTVTPEVVVRTPRPTRIVITLATVFAACSGLVAVCIALYVQRGTLGQEGSPAWLLPVAAALVVVGVSWILLGQTPRREMDGSPSDRLQACPACSGDVAEGWRLCPWCGYRSDGPQEH